LSPPAVVLVHGPFADADLRLRGFAGTTTFTPFACSRLITPFQLDSFRT
jgi:hypothetical protein